MMSAMDDEQVETSGLTAGERLRAAREEKKLSLEDIAAQTRIPQRHLEAIETADWEKLPAPTYTVGFAKSYASSVGLDRTEIGDQIRAEMGGQRTAATAMEVFEPADPARTMPKWLVLGAIVAVIAVVLLLSWLNDRSLSDNGQQHQASAQAPGPDATPQPNAPAAPPGPASAQGPVVLTSTEPVWVSVKDGATSLKQGLLQPGETYQVPATATAPTMTVGKPEALKVTVGTAVAPPVGPAGKVASKVSLKPADLMRGPAQPAPPPAAPATNAATR
jgi:cytoskeleton protein RodZ